MGESWASYEVAQDVELATPSAPESTAAAAAGVDDAKEAVLEGEIAPDCTITADFVDKRAGTTVIDPNMCRVNSQRWAEATNNVLADLRTNTMEIFYAPEGASFLGSTRILRAKDDTMEIGRAHV